MNTTDRYAKIRKALALGPTPGSREVFDLGMWDVEVRSSSTSGTICQVNNKGTLFRASEDGADRVGRSQGRLLSDAFFIAACDPDTIRELLAERDALAAEVERLRKTLEEIANLSERPYDKFPSDWLDQIAACPECQRYKDHPIQQGICDDHRKHLYDRDDHNRHETFVLGYRAKSIAREALAARRALTGGNDAE